MKKSVKFSIFAAILIMLLAATYYYLRAIKSEDGSPLVSRAELTTEAKPEISFITFLERLTGIGGERTYLILFENGMELRPGGGFIGSFAVVKMNNGSIASKEIHDTGIFDANIKDGPEAPYLIQKFMGSKKWGFRDSNWYLDFPTNVAKAMELYRLAGNNEKIDGVFAVTTELLPFLIKKTGPVKIDGIEGEFTAENSLTKLEYEVEVGYWKKGIEKDNRKDALRDLVDAILAKFKDMNKLEQLSFANEAKVLLANKNVQLFFYDDEMQQYALSQNWTGDIVPTQGFDYLSVVDTNMGALKTDRCLERTYDYVADFSHALPRGSLTITYKHNCTTADFMTADYHSYLRVYVPANYALHHTEGFDTGRIEEIMNERKDAVEEKEKDKVSFGNLAYIKLGAERSYKFFYDIDPSIKAETYRLYVQKQAGMKDPALKVTLKSTKGDLVLFDGRVDKDLLIENN